MARWVPEEDLSRMLHSEDFNKGYRLTWFNPERMAGDPTILFFKGFEVYRWEHDPTMGEVWDKIRELQRSEAER